MKWFKKLLGLKENKVEEEVIEESTPIQPTNINKKIRICKICQGEIGLDERYTKKMGIYFHKNCWKKQRRGLNV